MNFSTDIVRIPITVCLLLVLSVAGQEAQSDSTADSLQVLTPPPGSGIEGPVRYVADEIGFAVARKMTYLRGDVRIEYQDIKLDAGTVRIDWVNNSMVATAIADSVDSLGHPVMRGLPKLVEKGTDPIIGERLEYNFKTRRGKVVQGRTAMDPGYYRGKDVRKIGDETLLIEDGYFTTCDNEEHPHYYFRSKQMRVTVKKQAVAKPIVLYIADVPILAAPFGIFSLRRGRRSGIILPTYGETGFGGRYLKDFGYYWAPSDYWDATLQATFYEKTGFLYDGDFQYRKRYAFNGYLKASYSPKDLTTGASRQRWRLSFKHNQTIGQTLTINGNGEFTSDQSFINDYSTGFEQRLQQNLITNVSVRKTLPGSRSLTLDLRRNENLQSGNTTFEFPNLRFSQPSRSIFTRKSSSDDSWYHNIQYNYSNNLRAVNSKTAVLDDSTGERVGFRENNRAGWSHDLGLSYSTKVLKYVKLNQNFDVDELWSPEYLDYRFDEQSQTIEADTVSGFRARHTFNTGLRASTTIYGLWEIPLIPVQVIRHKMDPSIGFSYRPDFSETGYGYYQEVADSLGEVRKLDRFAGNLFGGTSRGEQRNLTMSLNNVIQGKMIKDDEERKFDLFRVNFGTSYNYALDSLNWNDLTTSFSARKGNLINLTANARHSFYKMDKSTGSAVKQNKLVWDDGFGLPELLNWNVSLNSNFSLKPSEKKQDDDKARADSLQNDLQYGENRYDSFEDRQREAFSGFDIPWSIDGQISYSYSDNIAGTIVRQFNMALSARLQLTEKWRIRYSNRLDLVDREIVSQTFTINRDLHCWTMDFSWTPSSFNSYYRLEIRVNESALRDLKLTKTAGSRPFF